jgi:hypothetical protein
MWDLEQSETGQNKTLGGRKKWEKKERKEVWMNESKKKKEEKWEKEGRRKVRKDQEPNKIK